ncbi:hypothetical protein ACFX2G_044765 [Malus domestica]
MTMRKKCRGLISSSNSDEEDFLVELTYRLAQSSLQPTHQPEAMDACGGRVTIGDVANRVGLKLNATLDLLHVTVGEVLSSRACFTKQRKSSTSITTWVS